jgi:orotate phosphoribosyltransferase
VNETEILEVLEGRGAVLRGHFRLSSGRHSDVFVQKFRVFENPRLTQRFGESIAGLFPDGFDLVASPAIGAITLGFAVALAADVKMIFAEREEDRLAFRRGFDVEPHSRVLVVEDVVTTGGSAREVVDLVKAHQGQVAGVGALLDRGDRGASSDLGAPLRALVRLTTDSWEPEECPLCARSEPLTDPGSRRLG